jgi:hypothetical protein
MAVSASFVRCNVHAGPESDVTNSKNHKNARPSRGFILYHLDLRKKIQTLIKEIYQKVSSQK